MTRSPLRRRASVALPLALLAATPLAARDPRIASRLYDPSQVVLLRAQPGIQTTVEFGEDERIENVAVGDSAAWQVTPNKRASLLFVKPMTASPKRTNMTVITDRRTYLFDLAAGPRGAAPIYVLRFTYPRPPRAVMPVIPAAEAQIAAAAAAAAAAAEAAKATAAAASPAELNFQWTRAGAEPLLPQRVFDDGRSTWLAWGKDVTLPAILVREPNGTEGPVNYTVKGDYVVVDGVPPQLVLRQGKQMATLTPDPRAARPGAAPIPLPGAGARGAAAATPSPVPAAQGDGPQTASIAR